MATLYRLCLKNNAIFPANAACARKLTKYNGRDFCRDSRQKQKEKIQRQKQRMALSDDNADKSFFSTAVILLVCKRYRVHQNFRHTFEQPLVIFAIK